MERGIGRERRSGDDRADERRCASGAQLSRLELHDVGAIERHALHERRDDVAAVQRRAGLNLERHRAGPAAAA